MASYIHIGPFGKCCDCGHNTFIRKASLLGEVTEDWTAPADLVRAVCKDIVRNCKAPKLKLKDAEIAARLRKPMPTQKRIVCSRCQGIAQKGLHWLEPVEGSLVGPFCKSCLLITSVRFSDERGYNIDYPVYVTAANKKILVRARATLMLGRSQQEECVLPHDDEVVLF